MKLTCQNLLNATEPCAVSGKADGIISGDRDLLDLKQYQGVPIMRVREFLNSVDEDTE